jgi:predicted esterase
MFASISHPSSLLACLLFAGVTADVGAAQTLVLPAWTCTHPDSIYAGGFETGEAAVPHDPSYGSGGAYPGSQSRTLHITGLGSGTQIYYLYLPSDYTPARSWPLVLALHGVAPGNGTGYASNVRDAWAPVAAAGHFIVAAPVADQAIFSGGQPGVSWLVPPAPSPNDYDLFTAIRADLESAYNIERTRLYGWGFSSGGHVMHALGVNRYPNVFNASTLAAYSVSAGDLAGMACAGLSDDDCSQLLAGLPRRIPVDLHIGNGDPGYAEVIDDYDRFAAEGWSDGQTLFYTIFVGGHTYATSDLQQAWGNLCRQAVVP